MNGSTEKKRPALVTKTKRRKLGGGTPDFNSSHFWNDPTF